MIGPILMFALAILFLRNCLEYVIGLIIVGLVSVAFFFQRRYFGRELSAAPAEIG